MKRLAIALALLTTNSVFAQFRLQDMPKRPITGFMSDQAKLDELERKAAHEQARAKYFAKMGKPHALSPQTTSIVIPTTFDACIARLKQLNRLRPHASKAATVILNYEFDVIMARAKKLSR